MARRTNKIGMKRLFTRLYTVEKGEVNNSGSGGYHLTPSGIVNINSKRLKNYVNKKVRAIIYVQTSKRDFRK